MNRLKRMAFRHEAFSDIAPTSDVEDQPMRYQANRSRNIALMERVTDVCVKCLYHLNSLPNRLFPQKNIHGLITSSDPQHEKLTVELASRIGVG